MNTVYDETKKIILHGLDAVLCRIIQSNGSSPRKAGASMVITADAKCYGSIGGGELERFCIAKALDVHKTKQGFIKDFALDASKKDDVSMICGGDVTVEFVFIKADSTVEELNSIFGQIAKPIRVWIFGAGHVGKELCPVLEHLGFEVFMLDDRPDFIAHELHPKASRCILCNYDDPSIYSEIDRSDYVVIMTHGHIADREVLLRTCKINPSYIGCIGSKKKVEATQAFLREHGIEEDVIQSIHSPIGIELYGDTPPEIAISVAAELIRHRALSGE